MSNRYSEHARHAGMLGSVGTIGGLLLWAGQPMSGDTGDWLIIAAVFALPMLFALVGLMRRSVYTAAWAAMLAVLYMGYTLAQYVSGDASPGLWLTLVSSSLLFAGSALYPRLRSREGTARKPSA